MKYASRLSTLCAAVCLVSFATAAQDKPKAPWEWKVTGDTVETIKIDMVLHEKIDLSSPQALAASYAMLTDQRESIDEMQKAIDKRWQGMVNDHMKPLELQVMTESAREAMLKAVAPVGGPSGATRRAATIVGEVEKTDESNSWVTCTQAIEQTQTDKKTGEVKTTKEEEKTRIHARKGADGNWRIEAIQEWAKDYEQSRRGKDVFKWTDSQTMLWFLIYMDHQEEAKIPALKQDTPEAAAAAVVDWLGPTKQKVEGSIFGQLANNWGKYIKSLHSDNLIARTTESIKANKSERPAEDKRARTVESITEGEGGVKKVKFKPAYEWTGSVEVHVQKVGDVWKAVAAGYYERDFASGDDAFKFVAEPDFYQLSWR